MNISTDKIKVQAFIDLIIFSKDLITLEQAFNHTHKLIKELNMEINMNKCILLSNSDNDKIIDEITNTTKYSSKTVIYLG